MLLKGFRHPLTRDDLWSLNPEDRCHEVYPGFEKNWQRELAKSNRYGLFLNSVSKWLEVSPRAVVIVVTLVD